MYPNLSIVRVICKQIKREVNFVYNLVNLEGKRLRTGGVSEQETEKEWETEGVQLLTGFMVRYSL